VHRVSVSQPWVRVATKVEEGPCQRGNRKPVYDGYVVVGQPASLHQPSDLDAVIVGTSRQDLHALEVAVRVRAIETRCCTQSENGSFTAEIQRGLTLAAKSPRVIAQSVDAAS
jgi:hypothetical protein